jgi:hypothetical protein
LKFNVGYPHLASDEFINCIIENKQSVNEVYFSWADTPSGRSTAGIEFGQSTHERQLQQEGNLKKLSSAGISLNLLFNANCYGENSQSREFFDSIGDITDYVKSKYNLSSITTASPLIAKFIKDNFIDIDVRASVNMEIGSIEGISYIMEYFDSFYVKRELNRNVKELLRLRKWCDEFGKQMYLLANSGCLNFCSAHNFHDNLVAHEKEISKKDNGYQFRGVCWDYLSNKTNKKTWLERTNFIRPEDVVLYEGITPAMKLATRVNSSPKRVLEAYVKGGYRGSIMELLEPNHSGAFYPEYVENTNFAKDFAKTVMNCDKQCGNCGYCATVMKKATIKLDNQF